MVSDLPNSDDSETSPQLWVRPEQYKKLIRVAHNPTEQWKPGNNEPVTG